MSDQIGNNWRKAPDQALRYGLLFFLILIAAACRWAPHPHNFAPIGGMAIFGGASCQDRRWAFLFPLAALALGDSLVGFHVLVPAVYGSFAIYVLLGRWLRSQRTVTTTIAVTTFGAIQFFVITNLATWWVFYPHDVAGLFACFIAALPLFQNTLAGDLLFTGLLFGGLAVAERNLPSVRERAATCVG